MDGTRFDELTRGLATARSRRGALKALAGGSLAGVLTLRGMGQVEAHHKTKHIKKNSCKKGNPPCNPQVQGQDEVCQGFGFSGCNEVLRVCC